MTKMKLSHDGSIVIPDELLHILDLQEGDELFCEERDGELVISTRLVRIRRAQQLFQQWFPVESGRSLADEIISERRAEGAKEEQEAQDELRRLSAHSGHQN